MLISPDKRQEYLQQPQQFLDDLATHLGTSPENLTITGTNNRVLQGSVGKGSRQESRQELTENPEVFGQLLDTLSAPLNERGPRFTIATTNEAGEKEKVYVRSAKGEVTDNVGFAFASPEEDAALSVSRLVREVQAESPEVAAAASQELTAAIAAPPTAATATLPEEPAAAAISAPAIVSPTGEDATARQLARDFLNRPGAIVAVDSPPSVAPPADPDLARSFAERFQARLGGDSPSSDAARWLQESLDTGIATLESRVGQADDLTATIHDGMQLERYVDEAASDLARARSELTTTEGHVSAIAATWQGDADERQALTAAVEETGGSLDLASDRLEKLRGQLFAPDDSGLNLPPVVLNAVDPARKEAIDVQFEEVREAVAALPAATESLQGRLEGVSAADTALPPADLQEAKESAATSLQGAGAATERAGGWLSRAKESFQNLWSAERERGRQTIAEFKQGFAPLGKAVESELARGREFREAVAETVAPVTNWARDRLQDASVHSVAATAASRFDAAEEALGHPVSVVKVDESFQLHREGDRFTLSQDGRTALEFSRTDGNIRVEDFDAEALGDARQALGGRGQAQRLLAMEVEADRLDDSAQAKRETLDTIPVEARPLVAADVTALETAAGDFAEAADGERATIAEPDAPEVAGAVAQADGLRGEGDIAALGRQDRSRDDAELAEARNAPWQEEFIDRHQKPIYAHINAANRAGVASPLGIEYEPIPGDRQQATVSLGEQPLFSVPVAAGKELERPQVLFTEEQRPGVEAGITRAHQITKAAISQKQQTAAPAAAL